MAKQQTRNRIPVRGRPGERERKDPNQPDPRPEQRFPGRDRQDDPNQRRRIDEPDRPGHGRSEDDPDVDDRDYDGRA